MTGIMINPEEYLKAAQIEFLVHEHPPLFTVDDAAKHGIQLPGTDCKNLFLRGKKGTRHFLIILPAAKRADLKAIAQMLGESKVSFASPEVLMEKLGLTPGSVSPLGLLNDSKQEVEVYLDEAIFNAEIVHFHPNRNTASLELTREMFHKFLQTLQHKIEVVKL